MDPPALAKEYIEKSIVKALYPGENLKPEVSVKSLLSDYEGWINQMGGKDYTNSLNAAQRLSVSEENTWDIRKKLSGKRKGNDKNPELEWHLLLHLARKLEESSSEAYELLTLVKKKKSPVEEALEEKTQTSGLIDDLPESNAYGYLGEYQVYRIIQAWLGLFGTYLDKYKLLITLDRDVMNAVTSAFEGSYPKKYALDILPSARIKIDDPALYNFIDIANSEDKSMNQEGFRSLENLIGTLETHENGYKDKLKELSNLIRESFSSFPVEKSISIDMTFLNKFSFDPKNTEICDLNKLNGKILIYLEKIKNDREGYSYQRT
ncbi:hypothetical protein ACFL2O_04630 [Thermodesulfobacteriota bacterium]